MSVKAERAINSLGLLMGSKWEKWGLAKLLMAAAMAIILYAVPMWCSVLDKKKNVKRLTSLQRRTTLKITTAYRAVSTAAASMLAGVPPIHLIAQHTKIIYEGMIREDANTLLWQEWQGAWDESHTGTWTPRMIPRLEPWLGRGHGDVSNCVSQLLSGHGEFGEYLHRSGK
ncbi:uncharacterized protein LOC142330737 [Lycorma delicatula]|uniref:uncharacterized protein LOC142330737 n=1 Tax=Lycorma delicatula TaxID=130591 RepID=UPI003F519778